MVLIACTDCNSTGLYSGFMERKGEAVVCLSCGGKGAISVRAFTGRKKKLGVKTILVRDSRLIVESNDRKRTMTYAEFTKKIPAPKV